MIPSKIFFSPSLSAVLPVAHGEKGLGETDSLVSVSSDLTRDLEGAR
jgi:hypothetical protein